MYFNLSLASTRSHFNRLLDRGKPLALEPDYSGPDNFLETGSTGLEFGLTSLGRSPAKFFEGARFQVPKLCLVRQFKPIIDLQKLIFTNKILHDFCHLPALKIRKARIYFSKSDSSEKLRSTPATTSQFYRTFYRQQNIHNAYNPRNNSSLTAKINHKFRMNMHRG